MSGRACRSLIDGSYPTKTFRSVWIVCAEFRSSVYRPAQWNVMPSACSTPDVSIPWSENSWMSDASKSLPTTLTMATSQK